MILALSLLTPYFYYIPRATLSSVIICAVIFMVDIDIILPIWRSSSKYAKLFHNLVSSEGRNGFIFKFKIPLLIFSLEKDLIPALVTFLSCLFVGVELGILIGILVDLAILIYFSARPHIVVEQRNVSTFSINRVKNRSHIS